MPVIQLTLEHRLEDHNRGKNAHAKPWLPWEVETFITFKTKDKARELEKYLKSGSGYAFVRKHLV